MATLLPKQVPERTDFFLPRPRGASWHAGALQRARVPHVPLTRRKDRHCRPIATEANAAPRPAAYPAGKRQAKVKLPALFILISVEQMLAAPETVEHLAAVVGTGATAVLLSEGSSGIIHFTAETNFWVQTCWDSLRPYDNATHSYGVDSSLSLVLLSLQGGQNFTMWPYS